MLTYFELGPPRPDELNCVNDGLFSFSATTYNERLAALEMIAEKLEYQKQVERKYIAAGEDAFCVNGYCSICHKVEPLITSYMYSSPVPEDGVITPNWREHLACERRFPNRVRASMHFAQANLGIRQSDNIYISERVTPLYGWLSDRYKRIEGSEFLDPKVPGGTLLNGVRHEDICSLSYPDASFDVAMTFDVIEHVFDLDAALAQLARILKPGGRLLLQAPTMGDTYDTLVRAEVSRDGTVNHILEPEYHGNPVDPENGSLCFRYLGVDMLDRLRAVGFRSAHLVQYWSKKHAYFGRSQLLFYAVR